MSDAMALRLGILLIVLALLILWWVNRPPRTVWTSEWRVSNQHDDPYAHDEHMVPELPARREAPQTFHRPVWTAPAAKGINGRRRA